MRIILSRKGFDSSYGKVPSPILPDGSFCSLPIPDSSSGIRYSQIRWNGANLGTVVETLTRGNIRGEDQAHLDPDLNPSALARDVGWRAVFGQTGAAQSHLARHSVRIGDLFLFFGWFRHTLPTASGKFVYAPNAHDLHALFGWLQIGDIVKVSGVRTDRLGWAKYHPHFRHTRSDADTLYVASESLTLPHLQRRLPGAGVFPVLTPILCLTAPSANRSTWRLPRWFYPSDVEHALSYHADRCRWELDRDCVHLRTVARGQEFILDCEYYPEAFPWLANLFSEAAELPLGTGVSQPHRPAQPVSHGNTLPLPVACIGTGPYTV